MCQPAISALLRKLAQLRILPILVVIICTKGFSHFTGATASNRQYPTGTIEGLRLHSDLNARFDLVNLLERACNNTAVLQVSPCCARVSYLLLRYIALAASRGRCCRRRKAIVFIFRLEQGIMCAIPGRHESAV